MPLADAAAAELAHELELPDDANDADEGALLYNAVGVRIDELPITPEKVLRALRSQGGARPQARR